MIRRDFIKGFSILTTKDLLIASLQPISKEDLRGYWVQTITRIVLPVLDALSRDVLNEEMAVEAFGDTHENRKKVTYLEAFGRSLAGLAPWLELGADETPEGKSRGKFIKLATTSIRNAVTPSASDFMNFTTGASRWSTLHFLPTP